ncbi:TPA: hypothetical protein N0F65_005340, partial [Lagenidium giganteum]
TTDVVNFQSLVGSLLWITRFSRPDIPFAVHRFSRRTHAQTLRDWALAKRISRNLSGTPSMALKLRGRGESKAGGQAVLRLRTLFQEIGLEVETPIMIDNPAAIKQLENEATSASTKHVDVKLKFYGITR